MSAKEMGNKSVGKPAEKTRSAKHKMRDDFLRGISKGREQAQRREGVPAEDARKLVGAWVSK